MNHKSLTDLSSAYLMNTYGKRNIVFAKGEGTTLWDINGREYLDFLSGIAVNNLGHCHPAIVDAIKEQCEKLVHCSNLYLNTPQIRLAEELCQRTFAERVFFCNSGAEAIETAIKLVRIFSKRKFGEGKNTIIAMENSFHGRTTGALSATGQDKYRKDFEPLLPGFRFAKFNSLESIKKCVDKSCCAIMVEPIQGEGGIVPATKEFMQGLRRICDEGNMALVADEIQCGLGRTGKLFAYQHYEIEPDLLTLAKPLAGGLPIGALLAKGDIADGFQPSEHASTFGGNPVCAAAALAYLDTIFRENLIERAAELGNIFMLGIKKLAERHKIIQEIRGLGLMIGVVVKAPARDVAESCVRRGLLIGTAGNHLLRILPPLIIKEEDCLHALEIIDDAFKDMTEPE